MMNGVGSGLALVDLRVVRGQLAAWDLGLVLNNEILLFINLRIPVLRDRDLAEHGDLVWNDEEREVDARLLRATDEVIILRGDFESVPELSALAM